MTIRNLYREIASTVQARLNCIASANEEWKDKHQDTLEKWVRDHFPSGSGFDDGTHIDLDKSTGEKLVFTTSFHHMDEGGGYDGWTEHTVTITPSLQFGYHLHISGKDRNGIKEYIHDCFSSALNLEIDISTGKRLPMGESVFDCK